MIKEQELKRSVELRGASETARELIEAFKSGQIPLHEVSFRALAGALITNKSDGKPCGNELLASLASGPLQENLANVVSSADFSHITGQVYYNSIKEGYDLSGYNVGPMFGVIQSNVITAQEKFAGISNIGDASKVIGENQEIPFAAVSEDYVQSPVQQKWAMRIGLSREALISDRTGVLIERCRDLGRMIGLAREKEAVDTIIANSGATGRVPYLWRGTGVAPWQTSATNSPYYNNVVASNGLVDQSSINNAYVNLASQTDPFSGEPLSDPATFTLLCTPANRFIAEHIAHSLQYRGSSGSSNFATNLSEGASVVPFNVVVSKYLHSRLATAGQADTNYYFGDFSRAYRWVRALDIEVLESLPNTGLSFSHDILQQFKVHKYETSMIMEPRFVCKNTA